MDTESREGKGLAFDSIILIAGKIAASINIIIIFIILSRVLSINEYGSFRQIWLLNKNLVLDVFSLGIPLSIFYFLPRAKNTHKKVFIFQTIVILWVLGTIFSFIIFLFSNEIAQLFNNPSLDRLLKLFCLYPMFCLPTIAIEGILISIGRTFAFSLYTFLDRVLLLIVVILIITIYKTVDALLLALLIYSFSEFVIFLMLINHYTKLYKFINKKLTIREQLKFSIPTGIANIVGTLNVELDKLMVSSFFSVTQFAKYSNGAFEIPFAGTVAASVSSVLMPEYVKKYKKGDSLGLLYLWHNSIKKVAILFIPFIFFFYIYAQDVITLLFSRTYLNSVPFFKIYLLALLPKVTWYAPILLSMGYSKEPFWGSLIALVSNVALNFIFIYTIGIWGPAIATVITTYILTLYYLLRIKTIINVSFRQVFPWNVLAKMIFICLPCALVMIPLIQLFKSEKIISIMIVGPVYFTIIFYLFKKYAIIGREEIEFIKNFSIQIYELIKRRNK